MTFMEFAEPQRCSDRALQKQSRMQKVNISWTLYLNAVADIPSLAPMVGGFGGKGYDIIWIRGGRD
jgi:hypothetical protein